MSLPTESINQIRHLSSPLKFFIYAASITATLALGFAKYSSLDKDINLIIVSILLGLFVLIIVVSFFLIIFDPSKYLYTRKEWIQKEQLTDSRTMGENKDVSQVNVNANPIELNESQQSQPE